MTKVAVYKHLCRKALFVLILLLPVALSAQYKLTIISVDKDSAFVNKLNLQSSFKDKGECSDYINQLPELLLSKGFPTASIDSVAYEAAGAAIAVFFGEAYKAGYINTSGVDKKILERTGWRERDYGNKPLNLQQLQTLQAQILDDLENNGYPFAKVQLDSFRFEGNRFFAALKLTKGPLYIIDSIRVYGDAHISAGFLQHYLDIPVNSIYQKAKLQNIRKKLLELPYVQEEQPWNLTMLGTGSIINLYLKPKKSSQINVLLGLLPPDDQSSQGKLRLAGEATINLRNAFGSGEQISLNWQQLQVKSPRLDLGFTQPYLLNMPFGITGSFNLFKKDSSFVNIGLLLGVQYNVSATQSANVFIQRLSTNLLTVDTVTIKNTKALPVERDVSSVSLGVDYDFNKTDYRNNPRKGWELRMIASAGTRKIRKNNVIVKLKDNSDPSFDFNHLYDTVGLNTYQFRIKLSAAHYFSLGGASALKAGVHGAWLQSPQLYRNELFQIGGYKLLRGFDEESIYASQYVVGTLEYRYLIGLNSFLFSFIDAGATANKSIGQNAKNSFVSGGLGLCFETKAGVFNVSYAAGKRDDATFNLRAAKIHLGYVSYF